MPIRIQWLSANRLRRPTVPVGCVALIVFLPMQIGVDPRTLGAFVLQSRFVSLRPIALRIPPQPSEDEWESRRRMRRVIGDSRLGSCRLLRHQMGGSMMCSTQSSALADVRCCDQALVILKLYNQSRCQS
jgi:hypothetical protein